MGLVSVLWLCLSVIVRIRFNIEGLHIFFLEYNWLKIANNVGYGSDTVEN